MATFTVPKWWQFRLPCTCPIGSVIADQSPKVVLVTEEQAWEQMYPSKRERAAADRAGVTAHAVEEFDIERWMDGHAHPECTLVDKPEQPNPERTRSA